MTDNGRIAELVIAGKPLAEEWLIDCHCHMGRWPGFPVYEGDASGMVRTMDECGLDIACTSHHSGIGPDMELGNSQVAAACEAYPGRFIGYVSLNGRYPETQLAEQVERYLSHPGFGGIKVHPSLHQYPIDTPRLRPSFEVANARGVPVLTHTWQGDGLASPDMMRKLATEFPNIAFILGHTGGTPEGAEQYMPVAKACENVYCDLTGSIMSLGMIEVLVREVGADRVLFGSDHPFIDCRPMIGYIAFAKVSDDDKRRILGLNAARLFGVKRSE